MTEEYQMTFSKEDELYERIEQLEKENAELKAINKSLTEEYIKTEKIVIKKSEIASVYKYYENHRSCGYDNYWYYLRIIYKNGVTDKFNLSEKDIDYVIGKLAE